MDMTLQEAVSARQEELLRTLQESIRIRSVQAPAEEGCPYGPGVRRCLDHALETARGERPTSGEDAPCSGRMIAPSHTDRRPPGKENAR